MLEILVVEDNREVASLIQSLLKGFCEVKTAESLFDAHRYLSNNSFDLLVVDMNLPDGSGLNLAMQLKESKSDKKTPFLFLSGDNSCESQLAGLNLGAEDYITKPFNSHVLRAKILNCLKRNQKNPVETIALADLVINTRELRVNLKLNDGNLQQLDLTALEFRLLMVLMNHQNQALSRTNIIDLVWNESTYITDRVVDQHIFCLRKKIASSKVKIKSIYGFGYRLEVESTKD